MNNNNEMTLTVNLNSNYFKENKLFTNDGRAIHNEIPYQVLYSKNLKPLDKLIFSDIYTILLEGHTFYKSNETIAKAFGVSKSSVSRSFRRLLSQHWINNGKHLANSKYYRKVTGINVKKVFGITTKLNGKLFPFINNVHLSNLLQKITKYAQKNNSNVGSQIDKPNNTDSNGNNLASQDENPKVLNSSSDKSNNKRLVKLASEDSQNDKPLASQIDTKVEHHTLSSESKSSGIMLHVTSSKSKNLKNKDDKSLVSINVYSNSCLNSTGLNKAGAQAHLARRNSSKHSIKLPSSKFQEIREAMHNAFPKLKASQFYERICISSWLNGKKSNKTPKFSVSEIKISIEKAKKYDQNHSVKNPFRLVYNILQTTRQEQMNAKVGQKKYQSKESKANSSKNKNASSKSSSSSSSSSDSDNSDDLEAAETLKALNDHSKEDADAKSKGFKPNSLAYSSYYETMSSFKLSFPYFVSSKEGYHEIDNWLRKNIKRSNDDGALISEVALQSIMNLTSVNNSITADDPVKYIDKQYKEAKSKDKE